MKMVQELNPLEQEWISKFNFDTGRLKEPNSLSDECYQWAFHNSARLAQIEKEWLENKKNQITTETKIKLAECYDRIVRVFKSYLVMNEDQYKFIALWTVATYFHEQFNTFPYLFFNAMRGSGKTRTLKLISSLGSKGDGSVQNNLTEAVLFRIPRGTTTCIDEVEQIGSKEKQTLRELLNSAYKKGMKVKRMRKMKVEGQEQQVVEVFEPYFPIVMCNIHGVEEVLGDRSIVMILEKSDSPLTKKVEDFDTNPEILDIKRTLKQISDVSDVTLREKRYIMEWNSYIDSKYIVTTPLTQLTSHNVTTEQDMMKDIEMNEFFNRIDDAGIFGRNFELLFPLLIIAKELGNDKFEEILKIAKDLTAGKREDEYADSKDASLYEFVSHQSSWGIGFIAVKELTSKFRQFLGEEDDQDRWLNERWMGKALKRLNLMIARKKMNTGRFVILDYAKAKEKLKLFREHIKEEIIAEHG